MTKITTGRSISCSGWAVLAGVLVVALAARDVDAKSTTWNFEADKAGRVASGFSSEVGRWVVVELSEGGKGFAQTAANPDATFNVSLANSVRARSIELSVRMKPQSGNDDQGGGLVWRAKDKNNYYIARFNPLEDNFRVYKVVAGKRTQLQNADIKKHSGWYSIGVRMSGDHIICSLDGKDLLEVHDATFPDSGKIGLWSKADAASVFDDLRLVELGD